MKFAINRCLAGVYEFFYSAAVRIKSEAAIGWNIVGKLFLMVSLVSLVSVGVLSGCSTDRAYPPDPLPTISIFNASVTEGGTSGTTNLTFTVALSAVPITAVTVDFATSDATAVSGSDYQASNGSLTIAAGSTIGTVTVSVFGDIINEAVETFTITLSNPAGATMLLAVATGVINNFDLPTLAIGNASVAEAGTSGTVNLVFPVTLSAVSATNVTVDYATSDVTATAGLDYTALATTLTIVAGSTTGSITVTVFGDVVNEATETFTLTLSNPTAAAIPAPVVTGTITNFDFLGVSIADASVVEGSAGATTNLVFNITLSAVSPNSVSFDYITADGTAQTATGDYTAAGATLSIPAGTTSATVTVLVGADTVQFEQNETLTLTLSNAVNAIIGTAVATGTILNDDAGGLLNDTGIVLWGDVASNTLNATQLLFPLQDADKGRDSNALLQSNADGKLGFSFTKLDANGIPLADQAVSFAVTPWSCVLDHTTGLMWEVKTAGVVGGLRNSDYTYSWFNSTGINDAGNAGFASGGTCLDGVAGANCDTEKYMVAVNAASLCGYTDWRLPFKEDLRSTVDYSIATPGPTIDSGYFPNTTGTKHWSASPNSVQANFAWSADFKLGSVSALNKTSLFSVRLVRGGL